MENPEKVKKKRIVFASSSQERYGDVRNTKGVNLDPIPHDLIIETLTRLPAKSLARFQGVSKLWSSIIHGRHFITSFSTRSSNGSHLLCFFRSNKNAYMCLFPQLKNAGGKLSSAAPINLNIPRWGDDLISLRGLICLSSCRKVGSETIICNPSTRQLITIPELKPKIVAESSHTYFCYDAVSDQYKLLRIFMGLQNEKLTPEHYVFVLGGRDTWRGVQSTISHCPIYGKREVCVDGVLYYGASDNLYNLHDFSVIVSFGVRSEEFNLIKIHSSFNFQKAETTILINYEGKLAVLIYFCLMEDGWIDLWVLEDAEMGKWSKMRRVIPPCWKDIVAKKYFLKIHGAIQSGVIIMAPWTLSYKPLNVFYYDLKRNNIRRVEIKGLPNFDRRHCFYFLSCLDYFESIEFLEAYSLPGRPPIKLLEVRQ